MDLNSFYIIPFSILKYIKQATYKMLFKKKKNTNKYSNNTLITPKSFHFDFEKGLLNAAKKIFLNINIKYCI